MQLPSIQEVRTDIPYSAFLSEAVSVYIYLGVICRSIYASIKGALKRCPPLPSVLRTPLVNVTLSPFFELFSLLIVIANAAVLGLERFNMPQSEVDALRNTNYVLVLLFGGELIFFNQSLLVF